MSLHYHISFPITPFSLLFFFSFKVYTEFGFTIFLWYTSLPLNPFHFGVFFHAKIPTNKFLFLKGCVHYCFFFFHLSLNSWPQILYSLTQTCKLFNLFLIWSTLLFLCAVFVGEHPHRLIIFVALPFCSTF